MNLCSFNGNLWEGINALVRSGYTVTFFNNNHKWMWHHVGDELRVSFRKPNGMRDKEKATDGNLYVLLQVKGSPLDKTASDKSGPLDEIVLDKGGSLDETVFDQFLFLRPPGKEEQFYASPSLATAGGSVLLAERFRKKLFVSGLFVRDIEEDNGLYYGYDLAKFELTRDREAASMAHSQFSYPSYLGNGSSFLCRRTAEISGPLPYRRKLS